MTDPEIHPEKTTAAQNVALKATNKETQNVAFKIFVLVSVAITVFVGLSAREEFAAYLSNETSIPAAAEVSVPVSDPALVGASSQTEPIGGGRPSMPEVVAALTALDRLESANRSSAAFEETLALSMILVNDMPELLLPLDQLINVSVIGAPSATNLSKQFEQIRRSASTANRGDMSFLDNLTAAYYSMSQRVGLAAETGADPMARISEALQKGDLAAADKATQMLPKESARVVQSWRNGLRNRLLFDAMVADFRIAVYAFSFDTLK